MSKWRNRIAEEEDIVVSSRVRLARNLQGHRFPGALDQDEARIVEERIVRVIDKKFPGIYRHFRTEDLGEDAKVLMENHLISPELIQNRAFSSFCLSEDENFNIMINEEDHIRMQALWPGMPGIELFEQAKGLMDSLEEELDFSFHPEFGYLTSCPTNTGTGLRASVMLHLPSIKYSGLFPGLEDSLGKVGLIVRGLNGEGSMALGEMYQISNQKTLGPSERNSIIKLNRYVKHIVAKERELRRSFLTHYRPMLEDQVSRSLGILKYAKLISQEEAMACISLLRVGISLGLLEKISLKRITDLFFNVQKHNMIKYGQIKGLELEENQLRSMYINEFFKEVDLDG